MSFIVDKEVYNNIKQVSDNASDILGSTNLILPLSGGLDSNTILKMLMTNQFSMKHLFKKGEGFIPSFDNIALVCVESSLSVSSYDDIRWFKDFKKHSTRVVGNALKYRYTNPFRNEKSSVILHNIAMCNTFTLTSLNIDRSVIHSYISSGDKCMFYMVAALLPALAQTIGFNDVVLSGLVGGELREFDKDSFERCLRSVPETYRMFKDPYGSTSASNPTKSKTKVVYPFENRSKEQVYTLNRLSSGKYMGTRMENHFDGSGIHKCKVREGERLKIRYEMCMKDNDEGFLTVFPEFEKSFYEHLSMYALKIEHKINRELLKGSKMDRIKVLGYIEKMFDYVHWNEYRGIEFNIFNMICWLHEECPVEERTYDFVYRCNQAVRNLNII